MSQDSAQAVDSHSNEATDAVQQVPTSSTQQPADRPCGGGAAERERPSDG
jgi:hypothetical protein